MAGYKRLITVKGKYLRRLIHEVNARKPRTMDPDYWMKLNKEDRIAELSGFFAMSNFTAAQWKAIEKEVFRIPWKAIIIILVTVMIAGALGYAGYKYNQFTRLPRIYAIGNDVPVYEKADSTSKIVSRMDIWGEAVSGKKSATAGTLLFQKDQVNMYAGEKDNFISWFTGKHAEIYVMKNDATNSEKEYDEYKRVLGQLKGESILATLSSTQRRVINDCIRRTNEFYNAEVFNFDEKEREDYKPFVMASDLVQQYIFLCLKTPNGIYHNIKIIHNQFGYNKHERIEYLKKPFVNPLLFKENPYSSTQATPIITFKEKQSSVIYQSFNAPYDVLRK